MFLDALGALQPAAGLAPGESIESKLTAYLGRLKEQDYFTMLGVPYGDALVAGNAPRMAREQAKQIADGIAAQGGPPNLADKEIVAMTAYLQRLGRDVSLSTTRTASAGGRP